MPRARNIKHEFFMNDILGELSSDVQLLYIGLWTLADREGKLFDRPKKIKALLFPYKNFDVEENLQALHDAQFIVRYEVKSMKYIWIPTFLMHQNPHHREKSLHIPSPNIIQPQPSPNLALTLPQPSPNLAGRNVECGMLNVECGILAVECGKKKVGSGLVGKLPKLPTPRPPTPTIFKFPLKNNKVYKISQEEIDHWVELYNGALVAKELAKMQGWLETHSAKLRNLEQTKVMINKWLAEERDKIIQQEIEE